MSTVGSLAVDYDRALLVFLAFSTFAQSGCELVVDFDRDKLDARTTVPTPPLPTTDAMLIEPDASASDGALIQAEPPDGGVESDANVDDADADAAAEDAAADAAPPSDAATEDAAASDAAAESPDADIMGGPSPDAGSIDAGGMDASEPEGGVGDDAGESDVVLP